MKKRTKSSKVRENIASNRALYVIGRPSYRHNPYRTPSVLGRHPIIVPPVLSIFGESVRKDFYKLLRQVSEVPLGGKLILDFTDMSDMKIPAVLILYAHLEIMLEADKRSRLIWRKPKDQLINKGLSDIGFWTLSGEQYTEVPGAIRICSVSYEGNQKGNTQPLKDAIIYAKHAVSNYGPTLPDGEDGGAAFDAISESFTNVWQHAYPEGIQKDFKTLSRFPQLKKWWIAQAYIGGQLFMAVYDVGVGIPFSIREQSWYDSFLRDFTDILKLENADGKDIKMALEYGSSRFKKQGRGNGFPAMKNFVEINPNGELCVMSGKALYRYHSLGRGEQYDNLKNRYPGTLIQWNVRLESGGGDHEN